MNITEYKTPYQDSSAFFGVRNGKLYGGHVAADGTPIWHYGMAYFGLGTAQDKNRLALGPYLAQPAASVNYAMVEAPVMQRNPRWQYATQLMWGFDAVKGVEDKSASKMRGTMMQTLESGELIYVPRYPNSYSDIGAGQMPSMGVRYNDRIATQFSPYSVQPGTASTNLHFRAGLTTQYTSMVADLIPLEGLSRFASLTYTTLNGGASAPFEANYFKVFDLNAAGAHTEIGKAQLNSSQNSSRGHVAYGIPLDESLIERDTSGNAVAYHLFYGKYQVAGETLPGKLIYKRIGLRPWAVPAEELELMNITTGTWPGIPGAQEGDCVVKVEGRAFTYTHNDIKYLVVLLKMGRHAVTGFTMPFTVKRAIITDGVAGVFETLTFPVPFTDYGNALVLAPDRKSLWHYSYTGTKLACMSFGATITIESQDLARDTYIVAVGVDNNQCLLRTDLNTKLVARAGMALPSVTLAFDKPAYALGATAILTVTTSSPTDITINIEVSGAIEKQHTKTLSSSTPATISLTVTGLLQASMVA